jgi:hypothetical protein
MNPDVLPAASWVLGVFCGGLVTALFVGLVARALGLSSGGR